MSRLLASPFIAVVIGVLACGTAATETLPTSTPISSPTAASTSKPDSQSSTTSPPTSTPRPNSTDAPASLLLPSPSLEPTPIPAEAPAKAPARTAVIVDQPEVGTSVGDTVPHFEFTLADGTKRSTAQLSSPGRPVFLFFFATW